MKAADIMSTNVVTVNGLATIFEATRLMKQNDVKTLIVDRADDSDAYGIVTQTDIARAIAEGKDPVTTYTWEVMTQPCIVINPNLPVEQIPRLFSKFDIRAAPVIKDKLLGIISITDILTKTDCLTKEKISSKSRHSNKSPELPLDLVTAKEWEVVDWEQELDTWCSG